MNFLVLFLLISLGMNSQVYAEDSIAVLELEILEQLDTEQSRALLDFKKSVEQSAYQRTMELCEGYRRVRGLGPHKAIGHWVLTPSQAVAAWGRTLTDGTLAPWSSFFGRKRYVLDSLALDFQLERPHLSRRDKIESFAQRVYFEFFGSMSTLYLVNSSGFTRGAMHCLNSVQSRDLENFREKVIMADHFGGIVGNAVGGEILGSLGAKVFHGAKVKVWKPSVSLLKEVSAKLFNRTSRSSALLKLGSKSLKSAIALTLISRLRSSVHELDEATKTQDRIDDLQDGLAHSSALTDRTDETLALSELKTLYELFEEARQNDLQDHDSLFCAETLALSIQQPEIAADAISEGTLKSQELESCRELYGPFLAHLKDRWTPVLNRASLRLQSQLQSQIQTQEDLTRRDGEGLSRLQQTTLLILENFYPLLELFQPKEEFNQKGSSQ